ncbi:MAG: helix-turn-helix domain-containing protein [Alphaproteobacteria bacterium]|nr:helix-turn-helix domain-containing protein [Alphaproteobacteria bacterium]
MLREIRVGRGLELRRVATRLRIRYPYLAAIEEGRFDKLPGMPYAVGFVRTYAEHLGLDGDEIVRRFKQETATVDNRTELVFPEPTSEGGVPGGAILLISLVLAVVGYVTWFYLSSRGDVRPEIVAAVPSHLAAPVATVPLPSADRAGASVPKADAPQRPVREDLARFASDSSTGAPVQPPAPEPPAAARPAAPESILPMRAPPMMAPVEPSAAAAATRFPEGQVAALPTAEADSGRVFGAAANESRVLIRATSDSWVQIRDADSNLLLTRVLRAGDAYRVPDRPGITMRTGNAGGLEVVVDGRVAPSLGPTGGVRRNVALDAERLTAGTAVPE